MEDMTAMHYEFVIRRAYNVGRGKKGGDADLFRSLIEIEFEAKENPSDSKIQTKYNKELVSIKNYLIKALDKVIITLNKQKASSAHIAQLTTHITNIDASLNKDQLASELTKTLATFNTFGIVGMGI
jgi:hypothetical protein